MITPNAKGRPRSRSLRWLVVCALLGTLTAFAALPKPAPKPKPTPIPVRARPGATPPKLPTPPPPPLSSR